MKRAILLDSGVTREGIQKAGLERIDSSGTVTGSRSKAGAKSPDVKHICMNLLAVKTQLYESELLLKHICMNLNDKTHLYESACY
ncbi:hypothetical protein Hdeb2414_s0013g00411671 [Helianthus debilis subsp. tardiflorus]